MHRSVYRGQPMLTKTRHLKPRKPRARPSRAGQPSKPRHVHNEFFRGAQLMTDDAQPVEHEGFDEIVDPHQKLFLRGYARSGRIGYACKAAGISQSTAWAWRHANNVNGPAFNAAFARALAMWVDRAEGELWRRSIDGVEKPVWHHGRVVGTERVFDTPAAMFMLKGARPDKYRDNVHHTGAGHTIDVDVHVHTSDDALEQRMRALVDALTHNAALPPMPATIEAAPVVTPEERAYQDALRARAQRLKDDGASSHDDARPTPVDPPPATTPTDVRDVDPNT